MRFRKLISKPQLDLKRITRPLNLAVVRNWLSEIGGWGLLRTLPGRRVTTTVRAGDVLFVTSKRQPVGSW